MPILKVELDKAVIIRAKVRALQTEVTLAQLVGQAIEYYLSGTALEVGVGQVSPSVSAGPRRTIKRGKSR